MALHINIFNYINFMQFEEIKYVLLLLSMTFMNVYCHEKCNQTSICLTQLNNITCNPTVDHCTRHTSVNQDVSNLSNYYFPNNNGLTQLTSSYQIKAFMNCRPQLELLITFTNISWTSLHILYKDEQNETRNAVREICVSNLSKISTLREYIITYEDEMNKTFSLDLKAKNGDLAEIRKFLFLIPSGQRMLNVTEENLIALFLYLDVTNLNREIILHIQTNSHFDQYVIRLYKKDVDKKTVEEFESVLFDISDEVSGEIQYKHYINIFFSPGFYYFAVTPNNSSCTNCTNFTSFSPGIWISNDNHKLIFVICIIIFVLLSLGMIIWCHIQRRKRYCIYKSLNVLVISRMIQPAHNSVVQEFISCLKRFEITVKDFSLIKDNPDKWCNDQFQDANVIIVIASPDTIETEKEIYRTAENISVNLISFELAKKKTLKKFCVIEFPYSVGNHIHDVVKNFEKFTIVSDFNNLLRFLIKETQPVSSLSLFDGLKKYVHNKDLVKLTSLIKEADRTFQKDSFSRINTVCNDCDGAIKKETNLERNIQKNNTILLNENQNRLEHLKISSQQESNVDVKKLNLTGVEPRETKNEALNIKDAEINIRNLIL